MVSFTTIAAVLSFAVQYAIAFSGDLTYYTPGLGSCGETNTETDMVVALSPVQFTTDPQACGKKIQIHMGDATATATVVDKCPGCSADSIDVSPAVFQSLAPLTVGRAKVEWDYAT
ncbi:RlpA-like double-psi beta-barrel-protein domain-containing protein-containing protein [Daldinia loculata]|uniref:RlpA-like double-psi beta-barrel-protein domain-containing protein-containing protein n=1 Tax=Daldinia loculata TaxID=103429 RepID=UPI0020C46447|nr:RlpA-like double-psi beta-barrel-protein domain-containing protein-containing protein [Daldinia loculata]KAI1650949.1 RlpA-like double-psi beta-barrel-protein domain-containing protein-containing protein [Daldinia loculata]